VESAASAAPTDAMVARWCELDRARAFVRSDHEVVDSTTSVRHVIAERLQQDRDRVDRDLLHAFGILGRLVGERGGSPTLAAAIVDGAIEALEALEALETGESAVARDAPWVLPARAALAEAFARARYDAARSEGTSRWEYPGCAVGVAEGTVAIAAGYPDDDEDALSAWASRVAHAAAMAGVRRAIVSGSRAAEAALADALEIAGIARVAGHAPPTRPMAWRR
jgi:hypothetical protein